MNWQIQLWCLMDRGNQCTALSTYNHIPYRKHLYFWSQNCSQKHHFNIFAKGQYHGIHFNYLHTCYIMYDMYPLSGKASQNYQHVLLIWKYLLPQTYKVNDFTENHSLNVKCEAVSSSYIVWTTLCQPSLSLSPKWVMV
jgi:hypothetical protein